MDCMEYLMILQWKLFTEIEHMVYIESEHDIYRNRKDDTI